MSSQPAQASRHPALLLCVGLATITFALYFPTHSYSWADFDDNDYVTGNTYVATGLRWHNIVWAFTHFHAGYWIPVTWISHMVDCQLWGLNPGPPHLINAALHSFNAGLLFLLFFSATGACWRSVLVAALFAWHPLHVESVAWLAARKDVLSTLFWLFATMAYIQYTRDRKIHFYVAAMVLFIVGLMAKPTLVTWPFTLLLLDFWPLRRFETDGKARVAASPDQVPINKPLPASKLFIEKIPFFLVSAIFSALTIATQRAAGALSDLQQLPVFFRLENALLSYSKYLLRTIWPTDLIVFYPLPQTISTLAVLGSAALLLGITIFTLRFVKTRPYVVFGWFWFLGTFVPMIGFFQSGGQAMADRFTYVPLIGIFASIAWGLSDFAGKIREVRPIIISGSAIVLGAFVLLSFFQMKQWRNPLVLFSRVLAIAGPVTLAHDHLGAEYFRRGQIENAIEHFRSALSLNANYPDAHNNLGAALFQTGQRAEALDHFEEALRLNPNYARAYYNYGNALFQSGRISDAAEKYKQALRVEPDYLSARNNLGVALRKLGKESEAMAQFRETLRLKPDFEPAQKNLKESASLTETPR